MKHLATTMLAIAGLGLTGCATEPVAGAPAAKTAVRGAAAGAATSNATPQLERCAKPLGTVALVEEANQPWLQTLMEEYRISSVTPLIRMMVQQSNCFVVVERGKAMSGMATERALAHSGELRKGSKVGKGQVVAADYTVTPTVTFSARGTEGLGAALGGKLFGSVGAAVGASMRANQASVTLLLTDNRTSLQVAASEGSAQNWDFGAVGGLFGGSTAAGMGSFTRTPEGKVLASAFLDSYNEMVRALRNYRAQPVSGAIGRGGKLKSK